MRNKLSWVSPIFCMQFPMSAPTAAGEVGTVDISTANSYSFSPAGNLIAGALPSAVVNGSAGLEGTGGVALEGGTWIHAPIIPP